MILGSFQTVIYHSLKTDNTFPAEINEQLEQLDFVQWKLEKRAISKLLGFFLWLFIYGANVDLKVRD